MDCFNRLKKGFFIFITLTAIFVSQAEENSFVSLDELSSESKFCISTVDYDIKGLTMEYALKQAVPVKTDEIFQSHKDFSSYLQKLQRELKNIRTLESAEVEAFYRQPNAEGVSLVHLVIHTKDSFNFIMIPYPKYDSNSGFLLKLKAKDNNFIGTMQPFNLDWDIYFGNKSHTEVNCDFIYPYKAGPFFASQSVGLGFDIGISKGTTSSFKFSTTSRFEYRYKILSVVFGLTQGFNVNTKKGANIGSKGYKYFLPTQLSFSLPLRLTQVGDFGTLVYSPSFSVNKNWAFSSNTVGIDGFDISFGHSLSFGKVSWKNNFREGLQFSVSNNYSLNTATRPKPSITLNSSLTGYINFLNRIGVYGRMLFFSNFFSNPNEKVGENMRGIINKRAKSDLAFVFNFDLPIKLFSFDFEKITGYSWTRYLGFELQLSPFLDLGLVHDATSGRYFSPTDIWCSGGLEVIVYPVKFRSIYVRASVGFDLRELGNVPGIIKLGGTAKRDGQEISEIFIGIGLHY